MSPFPATIVADFGDYSRHIVVYGQGLKKSMWAERGCGRSATPR